MDADPQGVRGNSQLICKRPARFGLGSVRRAMISQQQVAIFFTETFDTALQAVIFQLDSVGIRIRRRHGRGEFSPEAFKVDLVGNTKEISRAIAAEILFDFLE